MNKSLARYIWSNTRRQQIWILIIVLVSMYTYFLSLDLPKLIVNGPIQGTGFEAPGVTQTYMVLNFDLPYWGKVELFEGVNLDRFGSLIYLSLLFLLLVIVNGTFKFYINTYKGRLGERMLRRLRFDLVDRILRFPPSQFKRVKPAELSTMVKDEVEPLGGFIGDAFVQPVLLGGQAATSLFFIVVQNRWLGLIAAAIVALQLVIIPRMRRRLLVLGRERQLTARELSGRISEISEGISTIRNHDTSNYERADISARLGRIFKIRYDLYQWKFMVKFINNFLAQVTPFLFYLVGGYLVIVGSLDVGQLVAVIAAYKDLPAPLKDLIDWDQARQDVQIKYAQVYEQFDVKDMIDSRIHAVEHNPAPPLGHSLHVTNLTVTDDGGAQVLDRATLEIKPGERVAIIGSGGEALLEAMARIVWPDGGRVLLGSQDIRELPESVIGRRMAYAGSDAYLFQGTLGDNLFYGLKHAPLQPKTYEGTMATRRKWELSEALKSGNVDFDINADWVDYTSAGASGPHDLSNSLMPILDALMLSGDLLELGLRSRVDPIKHSRLAGLTVQVRQAFRERLQSENLDHVVVPFKAGAYNPEATVSENLLFGAATGPMLNNEALCGNAHFRAALAETKTVDLFYKMGLEIAENVIELFRDLPPDHPFFHDLTFMSSEQLPQYQALLKKIEGKPAAEVNEQDLSKIIALTFTYIESRHRFGLLDDETRRRIVEVRERFFANLPAELKGSIELYDPERFIAAASLNDNILLGRIAHQYSDEIEHIRAILHDLLDKQGLRNDVIDVGLSFNVGVGGRRLTASQRQKVSFARALLKRPEYLLVNRPLSALDQQAQMRIIMNLMHWFNETQYRPAVVAVLSNPTLASLFERIIVFERGVPVASGTYKELADSNAAFKRVTS